MIEYKNTGEIWREIYPGQRYLLDDEKVSRFHFRDFIIRINGVIYRENTEEFRENMNKELMWMHLQ